MFKKHPPEIAYQGEETMKLSEGCIDQEIKGTRCGAWDDSVKQ